MPITMPGWMIHKVLPDVGRNIGPCLYWATFAVLTFLPVAGVAAGGWFLAGPKLMSHIETLNYNAGVNADKQAVALADPKRGVEVTDAQKQGAQRELREEDWTLSLWAAGAVVAIALPLGFWTVYNTRTAGLFVKLFRPNLEELIAHEREYVYVAKTAEEREKADATSNEWSVVFAGAAVAAALGMAGGMIYATFATDVGYVAGLGLGLMGAGAVSFLVEAFRFAASFKRPEMRKLRLVAMILPLVIAGAGAVFEFVLAGSGEAPPAGQAAPGQAAPGQPAPAQP
jgi:hypothetical protein